MTDTAYKCTAPMAQSETNQCFITPKWFVDKSEYNPLASSFKLMINGEEAFGEIHRAIEAAKHSVHIICWGFQPSMFFLRDGASPSIGQLLEKKAMGTNGKDGILVHILCYTVDPGLPANVSPGLAMLPVPGVTGWKPGEPNTPGRRGIALKDRPTTHSDWQWHYDREWYGRYSEDSWLNKQEDRLLKRMEGDYDMTPRTKNLKFVGRGFSYPDRGEIALRKSADPGLSTTAKAVLSAVPSHHQKMVIIDPLDPQHCIGFLMGHNMLDEYWDTNDHSYIRRPPNRGRNGVKPRHDFSTRIQGPLCGDLYRNFVQAWEKAAGDKLSVPDFSRYPLAPVGDLRPVGGQVLRTQPQYGVQDIKKLYLQAVNNATQYIHIENQYFRWPPLADKIVECAQRQTKAGRAPEQDGPLYLFVITNADSEGMGPGVRNTYRMLESLGRANQLPEVTRQERPDEMDARRGQVRQQISLLKIQNNGLDEAAADPEIAKAMGLSSAGIQKMKADNNARIKELQAQEQALTERKKEAEKASKDNKPIQPEDIPGLKTLVCTLVAPDSPGRKGSATVDANGRALTREERAKILKDRIEALDAQQKQLAAQRDSLTREATKHQESPDAYAGTSTRYAKVMAEINQNAAQRLELSSDLRDLNALQNYNDPKQGEHVNDWVDVYIHAKLMLIDDAFMTVGSANINSRSMETDSELNIAHDRPDITQDARQTLWKRHTESRSGKEALSKKGMFDAYSSWKKVMDENKQRRAKKLSPSAALVQFYSGTTSRQDMD